MVADKSVVLFRPEAASFPEEKPNGVKPAADAVSAHAFQVIPLPIGRKYPVCVGVPAASAVLLLYERSREYIVHIIRNAYRLALRRPFDMAVYQVIEYLQEGPPVLRQPELLSWSTLGIAPGGLNISHMAVKIPRSNSHG